MDNCNKSYRPMGFTLIELMVVFVIIGILAAFISAGVFKAIESAKVSQAKTEISNITAALEMYKSDVGHYPVLGAGWFNFLKLTLEIGPPGVKGWNGPYMHFDRVKYWYSAIDPWGNAYWYIKGGLHNGSKYFDLWSLGPDGKYGTNDDITNW